MRLTESNCDLTCQKQSQAEPCSCKTVTPRRKHPQWPQTPAKVACHTHYTVNTLRSVCICWVLVVEMIAMHSPVTQTQHTTAISQNLKGGIFRHLSNCSCSVSPPETKRNDCDVLNESDGEKIWVNCGPNMTSNELGNKARSFLLYIPLQSIFWYARYPERQYCQKQLGKYPSNLTDFSLSRWNMYRENLNVSRKRILQIILTDVFHRALNLYETLFTRRRLRPAHTSASILHFQFI